ncbi:hypothetical protein [Teredinibacter sp. KSP-S5-2]|uniref:hypothetical protein n=1 Tax=Teredinibacter sp. KSP-S5-2 TaxID=3034506 RepID=UPI0029347C46|nr:hypothetical protein [Teredinibacter sp. KSP-S5-2]WNO10575.1 hypothetical protein P5V12_05250 [Teredinibacter sp. KSP-S5-2]
MKILNYCILSLICFVLIGAGFGYLSIDFEYPVLNVCQEINDYYEEKGEFPGNLSQIASYRKEKILSKVFYEEKNDDYIFYFCPTFLGPCEVCSKNELPYFDEI